MAIDLKYRLIFLPEYLPITCSDSKAHQTHAYVIMYCFHTVNCIKLICI